MEVLLFNAIWFSAAIASVLVFLVRPGGARRALGRMSAWAQRNARATTAAVFAVVGLYLTPQRRPRVAQLTVAPTARRRESPHPGERLSSTISPEVV